MVFVLLLDDKTVLASLKSASAVSAAHGNVASFSSRTVVKFTRHGGHSYSLAGPYSDFFAFLQLVAIFEPPVGGERVPRRLAFHRQLASLVHCHWNRHRF